MQLYDQIIDEAEELANKIGELPSYPSHETIVDAVSLIIGVELAYHTTGAYLAEAAYNRVHYANKRLEGMVAL